MTEQTTASTWFKVNNKWTHIVSDESKEKMRQAKLGKKASLETRKKLSALKKGKWQKDTVSYYSFHQRVRIYYGDIKECVYCGKSGKTEFASISHEAKHELTDYIALCRSCHRNYDKTWLIRKRDELGRFQ